MGERPTASRRVLTYGTFDLLHHGHLRLLERLRAFGGWLAVGLSTDAFNMSKGKTAWEPFELRRLRLEESGLVDHVFEEHSWEQKLLDIHRLNIAVLGMGYDWAGQFDYLATSNCRVIYLPRTPNVNSTRLRLCLDGPRSTTRRYS